MEFVANFDLQKNNIEGEFDLENTQFDAVLKINPTGASWGGITGNIENQTDLQEQFATKADNSTVEEISGEITNITDTLNSFGDIVTYNASDFATSEQGEKADTALQPNDDISKLVNDVGYITSADLSDYATKTELNDGLAEKQDTISDLSDIRSNAENGQSAYTEIQSYGDIVTYNADNFATSIQGGLADTALQPNDDITELNNNAGFITSADLPTVNNSKITIQKNGVDVDDFTLNQSSNQTVNITVPTDTDDLTNGAGFITSADLPTVNNPTITFQKNGTTIETITLNQSANETVNFSIPTQASDINAVPTSRTVNNKALSANISLDSTDVGALANTTTINDLTSTAQQNALNSGATSTNIGQIATNTSAISTINGKIPSEASTSNQLADKNFVNSSIATNTANFIGTFNSVAELEAYSGTLTNNDYAFVATTDSAGNTLYDRYKYTTATTPASWVFEYELNNSSFTSNQWNAINSGANTTNIGQIATNANDISDINTTIGGYGDIVTYNASSFATSAQGTKADTALQSGDNISELNNNANYITNSDLSGYATETWVNNQGFITGINSSDVTNALGFTPYDSNNPDGFISGITSSDVTTALGYTPYNSSNPNGYTSNVGTVTSVNNVSPVSGNVTLSIPTVNDGILTITQNGTSKGTFSANQAGNDTISLTDTTYNAFTGADSVTGGASGLVPAPSAGDEGKYLKGDGTWGTVSVTGGANTDLSNLTATGEAHFQVPLVSGTNIKTINNTSILGSGDIDTNEIFVATYNTTTFTAISDAYFSGKTILCKDGYTFSTLLSYAYHTFYFISPLSGGITVYSVTSSNVWSQSIKYYVTYANSAVGNANTPVYIDSSGVVTSTGLSIASSRFDGQWTNKNSSLSTSTSKGSYTISLSTYLPNDSYKYEVLIQYKAYRSGTGDSVGAIKSDIITDYMNIGIANANARQAYNCFIIPVGTGRALYYQISTNNLDSTNMYAIAYRRLGTNS